MSRRILFDALAEGARPSGAAARRRGLVKALRDHGGFEIAVLVADHRDCIEDLESLGVRALAVQRAPKGPLERLLRQPGIHRRAREEFRPDLLVAEALPWPDVDGLVATIHDLRHLKDDGPWRHLARRWMRRGGARAIAIHTPSGVMAREIERAFPELSERVSVVPNGVDAGFFTPEPSEEDAAVLAARGLRPGFLLCVGHLEPRKSPQTAVEARLELGRKGVDIPLILAGKGAFLPEELLSFVKAELPSQAIGSVLRDIRQCELPALYRAAAAVVAPSLYEGFGLVPLEAMACGAVVVASNIEAHREVVGDAALLFRVGDAVSLASTLLTVLERHLDVAALKSAAITRARTFRWEAAAAAFVASLP